MDCNVCKAECIGETPCKNCKEPIDKKVVLKQIGLLFVLFVMFYWIGVVV